MSLKTTVGFVSNVFSRMMHFEKAGDIEHGHKHDFDHLTLLAKGSLKVIIEGVETTFNAPHQIFIDKDIFHELVALEDDTLAFCIHAISTSDKVEDIVDPSMIPRSPDISREIMFKNKKAFCKEYNPLNNETGDCSEIEGVYNDGRYIRTSYAHKEIAS